MRFISRDKYFVDLDSLLKLIEQRGGYNAIVCLKRSGFIAGAVLSNKLSLPLFAAQELSSIPLKFKHLLIIDDKIHSGKSIQKIKNKLTNKGFLTTTAVIYNQGGRGRADIEVCQLNSITKMWYEV